MLKIIFYICSLIRQKYNKKRFDMTIAQIKKNMKHGDYNILQKLLKLSTESAARQKFLRGDKDAVEGMIKIQENRSIFCDLHDDEDCSCHDDLKEAINQKADKNHSHDWNEITGKPTEFPPTHHSHNVRDIEGLDDVLHTIDDIRNLSNQKLDRDGSNATGYLASTINNSHNHVNKAVLDTITSTKVNDWDSAASKAHNAVTLGSNATGLTITNQVLQFSNGYQLPTTIKVSEWDDAYLKRHTHGNKAVLDNLTQSVIDQSHAHSNKSVIDGITAQMVNNWNGSFANNHTHNNKSTLDGISSADVTNWDAAHANNHTHVNKVILDAITAAYTVAEKSKLATVQSNAQVNVNADWNATSGDAEILNKPSSFNPSSHNHAISDVTGLQSELDSKLETPHLNGFVQDVVYNSSLHTLTFYQRNEPNIVIDLPIEHLIKGVQLHGNDLVFTFEDGSNVTVPMNTLLVGVVKSVNGLAANSQGEVVLDITDIPGLQNTLDRKANVSGDNIPVGTNWNNLKAGGFGPYYYQDTNVGSNFYAVPVYENGLWQFTDYSGFKNWLDLDSSIIIYNSWSLNNASGIGSNNGMVNHTWFDYNWANTGLAGSGISFAGNSSYQTEIFAQYGGGGNLLGFRTRNDDVQIWNDVKWVWHNGNFDPDVKANISGNYQGLTVGNSTNWGVGYTNTFGGVSGTSGIDYFYGYNSSTGNGHILTKADFQNALGINTALNLNLQQVTNNGNITGNPVGINDIYIGENIMSNNKAINTTKDLALFLNDVNANRLLTGGLLASDNYADASLIPVNGIYSKGIIQTLSNGNSTLWNDAYNKGFINWGYFGNYFADYNDATKEGRYIMWSDAIQQSIPNRPSDYSGILEVTWSDVTNWCFQRYQEYGGDQSTYTRRFYNGAWSTWVKLLSSNNADLTQFVKKTGDTMQGSLIFPDNQSINFGDNASFGVKYDPTYSGLNFVRWGYTDGVLFIGDNERIGIGTTNPQTKLHTVGNNYTEGYAGSMYGHTIMQTTGTGHGLSLYGTQVDQGYNPEYGLMFATTGNYGTMGSVNGDWATYFTMAGASNRGWIFRHQGIGNVASINGEGVISTMYHGNSGQWQSAWVNGLVNRGDIYTSNIDFNNLPIENRIAGIHTGNGSGNTNLPDYMNGSYGVHTRTVGGAFTTDTVYGNGGEMWYKTWYHPSGANGTDWRKVWDNVNLSNPATQTWVNSNFASNAGLNNKANIDGSNTTGGINWDIQRILSSDLSGISGNGQVFYQSGNQIYWGNPLLTMHNFEMSNNNGLTVYSSQSGSTGQIWHQFNFDPSLKANYDGSNLTNIANWRSVLGVPTNNNQLSNGSGYITASALNGYASQSWVNSQGFLTSASLSNVSNATVTYQGTGAITGGGSHTINQSGNSTYNFDLTNQTKSQISLGVNAYNSLSSKQDTLVAGSGISIVGNTISSTNSGGGSGIERIFTDNSQQPGSTASQVPITFTSHEAYGKPEADNRDDEHGNLTMKVETGDVVRWHGSFDSTYTDTPSVGTTYHIDIDGLRRHIYNIIFQNQGSGGTGGTVIFDKGIYEGDQINITVPRGQQINIQASTGIISSFGSEVQTHANLIWSTREQQWVLVSYS